MKICKTLFTLLLFASYGIAIAQSAPIDVHNNTDCYFLVRAVAIQNDCQSPCITSTLCVPPNSTVQINPCSFIDAYVWCNVRVTPADGNCQPCPADDFPPVTVAAPGDPCSSYPHDDSGLHCECDHFQVHYNDPYNLVINP